jgi:hypothetical protein
MTKSARRTIRNTADRTSIADRPADRRCLIDLVDAERDSGSNGGIRSNVLVMPVGGGGGEGLARAQADLVRVRANGGEVRWSGWVYVAFALAVVASLLLPLLVVAVVMLLT